MGVEPTRLMVVMKRRSSAAGGTNNRGKIGSVMPIVMVGGSKWVGQRAW